MTFHRIIRTAFSSQAAAPIRHSRLGVGILGGLCLAMLVIGFNPALGARLYFHPGHDPLWRGLVAQLVHLDTPHLLMNLLALLALGWVANCIGRMGALPGCLIVSALAVCLGLQSETPALAWYVGLSGALHGLAVWLALELAWQTPSRPIRFAAVLVCAGLAAKLGLGARGNLLASVPVAHGAHLYGFIGGLCHAAGTALIRAWRRRSRRPT